MKRTIPTRSSMLVIAIAFFVFVPDALAKPYVYRVSATFTQTRPWTHHYEQVSEGCVRTDDGNGQDNVKLSGTGKLGISERGVAVLDFSGKHTRTGIETHTVSGAECAPSAVFPSTWSLVTQSAGTVTMAESNVGCGPKDPKTSFPTLKLIRSRLILHWGSDPTPDFKDCPYFEGANEASSGNSLPGPAYRDLELKVRRSQLKAGKRRVTATGGSKESAFENCSNLQQPCPEGVTYNATASVDPAVKVVLTRIRR